jgi:succinate dehydrogenase hydrophobic anchor subunit
MVEMESKDKKAGFVFYSSIVTSAVLVTFFLLGSFLTNISQNEAAYTQVDMAAGSIFVFVLSMIISLSLLPKIMDWRESRE